MFCIPGSSPIGPRPILTWPPIPVTISPFYMDRTNSSLDTLSSRDVTESVHVAILSSYGMIAFHTLSLSPPCLAPDTFPNPGLPVDNAIAKRSDRTRKPAYQTRFPRFECQGFESTATHLVCLRAYLLLHGYASLGHKLGKFTSIFKLLESFRADTEAHGPTTSTTGPCTRIYHRQGYQPDAKAYIAPRRILIDLDKEIAVGSLHK